MLKKKEVLVIAVLIVALLPQVAFAVFSSSSNTGVPGIKGTTTGTSSLSSGVMGHATVNAAVTTVGVYGLNVSTKGIGVLGSASGGSGTTYGVYGTAASPAGYGVYSNSNLGVASGRKIICTRCVTGPDLGLPIVRVYNTVNQSVPNNTDQGLIFNSEEFDPYNSFDANYDPSRLVAAVAGYYQVSASVSWATNATGERRLILHKNDIGQVIEMDSRMAVSGNPTIQNLSTLIHLNVGEHVELHAVQTSGGPLNAISVGTIAGSRAAPVFAMHYVSN